MDDKVFNKFNNVTCYLTSNTGNITIDAPFAGLPQYDINIAPTGVKPGVYKPLSLLISATGQILDVGQGIDTGTQITTSTLKIQNSPGAIAIDLPDGVPLSITSSTLDVVPDTATGGYAIDLMPNSVTSVVSKRPGLVDGNITDNELTLSPSPSVVTNVSSSDLNLLEVSSALDTNTGGTAVVLTPNENTVTSVQTTQSALVNATISGNQLSITPNPNLVTKAAVTATGSGISLSATSNTVTLSLPPSGVVSNITAKPPLTAATTSSGNGTTSVELSVSLPPSPAAPFGNAPYVGSWSGTVTISEGNKGGGSYSGNVWIPLPGFPTTAFPCNYSLAGWAMWPTNTSQYFYDDNNWVHNVVQGQVWGWPTGGNSKETPGAAPGTWMTWWLPINGAGWNNSMSTLAYVIVAFEAPQPMN